MMVLFVFLYAAREIKTGKLVSDITNPGRKYWDRKGNAINAITNHNNRKYWLYDKTCPREVELVTFELVEVKNQ